MKKEKILINIENLKDYYEYKKIGYNNFLFAVNNYSIGYKSFDIKEIKNLDCNKYLLINRVLDNVSIESFKNIIPDLEVFNGIFFEDIGVYSILKNKGIKLIWNQSHFATNYSSINYWNDLSYTSVISNELTKEEVSEILDKTNKPLVLNIFGKNPAMYSRRTLLTNFNKYYNLKYRDTAIIKDTVKDTDFLAKESEYGTILFDNNYFSLVSYLNYFKDDKVLFYLVYPFGLDVKEINDILNNKTEKKYSDLFMDKKTIYKLEVK